MSERNETKANILSCKSKWREHLNTCSTRTTKSFNLGVAASFTAEPLMPFLGSELIDISLAPEISFAPFNQLFQACLSPFASFNQESLDAVVILWRIEDIAGEELDRWTDGEANALQDAESKLDEFATAVLTLRRKFEGTLIVGTPPYPQHALTTIRDLANPKRTGAFHRKLLDAWCERASTIENVRLLDVDALQRQLGLGNSFDIRKWYLYRQPFTEALWLLIAKQIARIIRSAIRPAKKCIAVDCDNTLWGGIVGEDGLAGIVLGDEFPGQSFVDFQKLLLSYKKQGLLLTILSKNNEQDVWQVFEDHDAMVLSKSDLAGWRINWNPKADNLKALAAELNIGVDSFIFIDDNPFEIDQMRKLLPEIECIQIPEDPAALLETLKCCQIMDISDDTQEDRARTGMMLQERERRALKDGMSETDFLESLELQVEMFQPTNDHVARVAQLINKTNQFNLTTIRRSAEEVSSLLHSDRHRVYAGRISDKFGKYGLTIVIVVDTRDEQWSIDTFLMSCRVMGRHVELAAMAFLAEEAKRAGSQSLSATYVPTSKNAPIKNFLPNCGFAPNSSKHTWILPLSNSPTRPPFITVRTR